MLFYVDQYCMYVFIFWSQSGDTVLIAAVRGGHVEIVRALLHKYADIDVKGQVFKFPSYFNMLRNDNYKPWTVSDGTI